ncbi:hypothetical protein ACFWPU_25550 [Streptomyces sp. NPDC058471]|uniref:hypothetical protein n=1 Tax=Streptomyces sp. NPDC058471 TaxID=3346516 RepID=UPI00366743D2
MADRKPLSEMYAPEFTQVEGWEFGEMGKAKYEALLRTKSPDNYLDPFGNGSTCYRVASDGLFIDASPFADPSPRAPYGVLYWSPARNSFVYFNEAERNYLVNDDPTAPASQPGKV